MGFLTEIEDNIMWYAGHKFIVNPAFDIVLDIQKLYQEEELTEKDKLDQALQMLIVNKRKLNQLTIDKRAELLNAIYERYVNTRRKTPVRQKLPALDFEYDGEFIYASFMLDYNIDLLDAQGRLSWKKFIALFQGLSEQSKIREVMRIRNMEIPRYNGKNGKEIQEIQELKSHYALPVRGGGGQQGLDLLFSTLEGMTATNKGR